MNGDLIDGPIFQIQPEKEYGEEAQSSPWGMLPVGNGGFRVPGSGFRVLGWCCLAFDLFLKNRVKMHPSVSKC